MINEMEKEFKNTDEDSMPEKKISFNKFNYENNITNSSLNSNLVNDEKPNNKYKPSVSYTPIKLKFLQYAITFIFAISSIIQNFFTFSAEQIDKNTRPTPNQTLKVIELIFLIALFVLTIITIKKFRGNFPTLKYDIAMLGLTSMLLIYQIVKLFLFISPKKQYYMKKFINANDFFIKNLNYLLYLAIIVRIIFCLFITVLGVVHLVNYFKYKATLKELNSK